MLTRFVLLLFVLSLSGLAHATAIDPQYFIDKGEALEIEELIGAGLGDAKDYQIGSEWGKVAVRANALEGKSAVFRRAALATAKFGGGTAFYIGQFNGHHMMATNYHVMPKADLCAARQAIFPLLGRRFSCEKFYGNWSGIDLALFSITVNSAEDEAMLEKIAANFSFNVALYPGQELITIGFGTFRNPARDLVANDDADCKVFSGKEDYRFIADPDRINPADYKAWSFATGCDVSHGDSGSAMVDRVTGEVVGIIWTTATDKDPRVQDSAFLEEVLKRQSAEVWTQLSYAVPAPKIREVLADYLSRVRTSDPDLVPTLEAIIEN